MRKKAEGETALSLTKRLGTFAHFARQQPDEIFRGGKNKKQPLSNRGGKVRENPSGKTCKKLKDEGTADEGGLVSL